MEPSPARSALSERIVLGIDPGTRVVGYGAVGLAEKGPIVLGAGVIRAASDAAVPQRLAHIRRELDRILIDLRPGTVVVEEAFAHRNVQSALRIGEGRGVVLSCAISAGAAVVQIPPAVAKKALVGNGAADKFQVAAMVARLLRLEVAPEPLDATDALALALTFALRRTSVQLPRQRG